MYIAAETSGLIEAEITDLKIVVKRMTNHALPGDDEFTALVLELAQSLTARGWTLATAESCTGGWIAK